MSLTCLHSVGKKPEKRLGLRSFKRYRMLRKRVSITARIYLIKKLNWKESNISTTTMYLCLHGSSSGTVHYPKKRSRVNVFPNWDFLELFSTVHNFSGKFKFGRALIKTISSIGRKIDQELSEGGRVKPCKASPLTKPSLVLHFAIYTISHGKNICVSVYSLSVLFDYFLNSAD